MNNEAWKNANFIFTSHSKENPCSYSPTFQYFSNLKEQLLIGLSKVEIAGYQHFVLSPQFFQKALSSGAPKVVIMW